MKVAAVILAAGCSSRMGRPKQELTYKGASFLRRAAETALAAGCDPVCVVLGAMPERIAALVTGLRVITVENPDWESGMGSSIRVGVQVALAASPDALLLMLADQPLVGLASIGRLFSAGGAPCDIAASAYSGTMGAPVLFKATAFPALLSLQPDEGAKKLLHDPRYRVLAVAMPEGAADIDTPEDYRRIRQEGDATWNPKANNQELAGESS